MNNTRIKYYLLVVLTFLLFAGLINCKAQPPSAQEPTPPKSQPLTTISSITGDVSVMKAGTKTWTKASIGITLGEADSIRTGADSIAVITFFEGSTIELDGNTEIKISELIISTDSKTTKIRLYQEIGKTTSRVEKLVDPASRYEIETPAGSAVARGSWGIIIVFPNGDMQVINNEGLWCTIARGWEVCFPEGYQNYTIFGQPPGQPVPQNPPPPPPPKPELPQDQLGGPSTLPWEIWLQTLVSHFNTGTLNNVSVTDIGNGDGTVSLSTTPLKDQSMEETDGDFSSIWGSNYLAQTFTAGMTGALIKVDLYLLKNGSPASLILELRNSNHLGEGLYEPGDTVLATRIIPASNVSDIQGGALHQFSFIVPYSITSGTHYSIVLHQSLDGGDAGNYYGWLLISFENDQYAGGAAWESNNSGGTWALTNEVDEDFNFATYVTQYVASGTLESSSFNCSRSAEFASIAWVSLEPAGTSIKFQLAANNDNATWNFVGPDGTASTYYETTGSAIWSGHNGKQYIKYKAFLSTTDTGQTPLLHSVAIVYR